MLRTTLGREGDPHAEHWEGPRWVFAADNRHDPDLVDEVLALGPGEVYLGGGGATPPFLVQRVDFTRETCPDCGRKGPHDDNGFDPDDVGYAVKCDCGHEWAPNEG